MSNSLPNHNFAPHIEETASYTNSTPAIEPKLRIEEENDPKIDVVLNHFEITNGPKLNETKESSEQMEGYGERSYHMIVVIKVGLMAAMGGFLFGYDTGGAGGAILFLHRDFPDITTEEKELIISITAIGGAIGSLIVGPIADTYGRRISIIISDFLFVGGSLWLSMAPNVGTLIVGRFVIGLGVGATCMIIPVYLAEVSPKMIRGSMVTFNIICVCLGQIFAYLVTIALHPNWRLMFAVGAIPAFGQLVSMMFIKESPKYLIKVARKEEAVQIMRSIYNTENATGAKEIQNELDQMEDELKVETQGSLLDNFKELITIYRRILIIGVMLQVFQQFGGINTAMYYGPEMMQKAGFGGDDEELSTLLASLPLACIDCLGTIIACVIVDTLGRRYSMLRTLPGAALGMVGLGIGALLHSIPGKEETGKWISCFALFFYMFFFSVGMNGQPWLVNSEIYPMHLRGLGNACSTTANWISDYTVTMIFLSVTSDLTGEIVCYFMLALINLIAFVFIYKLLPETKGKTLQEILILFVKRKSKKNLQEPQRITE